MSNKNLSTKPKKISDTSWWYEDAGGIEIIVQHNQYTTHHRITWRDIRRALARKDRP